MGQPLANGGDKAVRWEQRGGYFDAAEAVTPLLAVESKHGAFVVSTSDARVGRSTFVKGQYGGRQLRLALGLLKELGFGVAAQGTLLDVGANIGTITIPAVLRYGMPRAVAVEAHPDNFRLLRMNIAYNDLEERVDAICCALSDRDGQGELERVNRRNFGSPRIRERGEPASSAESVTVPLRSLDSLEDEGRVRSDEVSLAWLDVQGHEPHVLAGAGRLLARRVPVVTEFHPVMMRRNGTLDAMVELIRARFGALVQLRRRAGETERPAVRDPARLDELVEELGDTFTDLLLLPR